MRTAWGVLGAVGAVWVWALAAAASSAAEPPPASAEPAPPETAETEAEAPPAMPLPPDSLYVTAEGGRLVLSGRPQRFWAAIGKLYVESRVEPGDPPAVRLEKARAGWRATGQLLDRFRRLGFNAFRFWKGVPDGDPRATPPYVPTYTPGDGSRADDIDAFVAAAKTRGMRIWLAALNGGEARPEDVGILNDPATAEAWAAAVREQCRAKDGQVVAGWKLNRNPARAWDARLEALAIRHMQRVATHVNPHTGLRWCDDPVFAVWELSNEEWWVSRMVRGQWQTLPAFFRGTLAAKWNAWLREQYRDDAGLGKAWGELLPGESLDRGTVLFAPMRGETRAAAGLNDANPHAKAALEALPVTVTRADVAPARASDVLRFLVRLQIAHKQREAAAIKPLGKSTRLSPMVYDTGIGYEVQSQYLHQHADAVAHDAYVNGWGPPLEEALAEIDAPNEQQRLVAVLHAERMARNAGPWVNWLLKPPGIHQGVPWLEHNRHPDKPFLCYETQIQQPAKYRADFPLRLAALASLQDWGWVSWHYFQAPQDLAEEARPFTRPMDVTTGGHPQGYHYTFDEVQAATMRAAGLLFRHFAVDPAPEPTTFVYGRHSLYDPASMNYAGSYGMTGLDMVHTVYQHGVRLVIDPGREDDEARGPVVAVGDRHTHNPYTPTDQVTFDWKRGWMKLDAPAAMAWAGLFGRTDGEVAFERGARFGNVRIENPPGIFDPVSSEEGYLAFALVSRDGKPLAACRRAVMALVSTSFNAGYAFGPKGGTGGGKKGGLPVLEAAVGATVHCPALDGFRYTLIDWELEQIGTGIVENGRLEVPPDPRIFTIELSRFGLVPR